MITFLKWFLLIIGLVLFQTSMQSHYLNSFYRADLLLIIMVILALRAPVAVCLPAAYTLGLLKDCISGLYFGLNGVSFLFVSLLLKGISDRLYVKNAMLLVLTVTISTLAVTLINLLFLTVFADVTGVFSSMLATIIPHLLINAFAASLFALLPESVGAVRGVR